MKNYFGSFPVPRQHGVWAMFLVPAVMAATLAERWRWSSLFLILAFILIFLSHQPAIHLLRRFRYQQKIEKQSLFWVILL
ncbi:MAG: YwiC-like family protein, partial [Candidatus Marinimicrobia bacterium]|nr:YwiC-like family protein [Candidatus Neomarinimicrobiota bacterium]